MKKKKKKRKTAPITTPTSTPRGSQICSSRVSFNGGVSSGGNRRCCGLSFHGLLSFPIDSLSKQTVGVPLDDPGSACRSSHWVMVLGGVFGGLYRVQAYPGEQGYHSTPKRAMPTHRRGPQGLAFGRRALRSSPQASSKQASKQGANLGELGLRARGFRLPYLMQASCKQESERRDLDSFPSPVEQGALTRARSRCPSASKIKREVI